MVQRALRYSLPMLFVALFLFPTLGQAQFSGAASLLNPSQISVSPAYPDPGESVELSLNDYSIDTSGAKIAWFRDGQEITAARNLRNIRVTAGALGSSETITVKTTLSSGSVLTATAVIKPVRVDLLVEADTLIPAFYAGRALPSSGSTVRVTALPFTGTPRAPEAYSYRWSVADKVVGGGSQFGKNSVVFRSQFEKVMNVAVEVIDSSGKTVAKKSVNVPIVKPELHFYTVNPLAGESPIAMGNNFIFSGEEMLVRAEPYFVDNNIFRQNHTSEWKINNQTIENPSADPQEITLRKQGDRGTFSLEFSIRNLQNLLQGIEDSINIRF